jgi:hypothetical protein
MKRFIASLVAVMFISGLAMAAPVAAHDGATNNVSTQESDDEPLNPIDPQNKGGSLAEKFREQAQEKLQEAKTEHQGKSAAQIQKSCEARKTNLTKRMNRAVTQAKKHKAVFDNIYTKVKDFYAAKQLSVANYADLTAAVDAAQSDAQASIDALSELDVNVDCTSQTVSTSVSAFRAAVKSTRDSLKTYRKSIVALITAVKGASTSKTDSTNDTEQ